MFAKIKHFIHSLQKINVKDTSNTITPCDFLLFCHDVDRGISLGGKAYSPLMDSIKDAIQAQGFTCVSIAHPWSTMVGDKAYGQPVAMNRSYFLCKVLQVLFGRLGLRPEVKLYERLMREAKPKAIITIGCQEGLCEAARNMNIFHAELLHGIGYTPMPWGWDKKEARHLPQGILSLDAVSTTTFSALEKHGIVVKEIPHPFLLRFHEERFNEIPKEWLPAKKDNNYKKEILISLQWGYAAGIDEFEMFKGTLSNGLFYEALEELIKRTKDTVFWRFRFHPVQYRQEKKYRSLFDFMEQFVQDNKNCEWRESTYIPLPSLLQQCAGHITMSSMTNYEAAYLGVPTLALCPSLRPGGVYESFFEDLVEQGYVTKQKAEMASILEWVNNVERREPLLSNLDNTFDNSSTVEWLLSQSKTNK